MNPEPTEPQPKERLPESIDMPAPTVWPMVTAFGLTLLLAGLVTHWFVSLIGLLLALRGAVGWFREVMPHDRHEAIAVVPHEERATPVRASHAAVQHLVLGEGGHRVRIPAEYTPYSAGIKGGIAGGIVMAIMAVGWSMIVKGSPWYVVNLLAASAVTSLSEAGPEQLLQFSALGLFWGIIFHATLSFCIGLLYAVALPMFSKHIEALVMSSLIMPIAWTAVIGVTMPLLNPALSHEVNWTWFFICQLAFGAVCGYVVYNTERLETMQTWPLISRMGMHATQVIEETDDGRPTEDGK